MAGKKTPKVPDPRLQKIFYRRHEAAFVLGLSLRAIDYLIASQKLGYRKYKRIVLIPASDVELLADAINHDRLAGSLAD